jgi:hypothetical protein
VISNWWNFEARIAKDKEIHVFVIKTQRAVGLMLLVIFVPPFTINPTLALPEFREGIKTFCLSLAWFWILRLNTRLNVE